MRARGPNPGQKPGIYNKDGKDLTNQGKGSNVGNIKSKEEGMTTITGKPTQTKRLHITLTYETWQELIAFIKERYGSHNGLSLTVERAVREFLARQEA